MRSPRPRQARLVLVGLHMPVGTMSALTAPTENRRSAAYRYTVAGSVPNVGSPVGSLAASVETIYFTSRVYRPGHSGAVRSSSWHHEPYHRVDRPGLAAFGRYHAASHKEYRLGLACGIMQRTIQYTDQASKGLSRHQHASLSRPRGGQYFVVHILQLIAVNI